MYLSPHFLWITTVFQRLTYKSGNLEIRPFLTLWFQSHRAYFLTEYWNQLAEVEFKPEGCSSEVPVYKTHVVRHRERTLLCIAWKRRRSRSIQVPSPRLYLCILPKHFIKRKSGMPKQLTGQNKRSIVLYETIFVLEMCVCVCVWEEPSLYN